MKFDWKPLHEFWFGPNALDKESETKNRVKNRMRFWFYQNSDLDAEILEKFAPLLDAYRNGELEHWKDDARSYVTLIVLLDQVPRNAYRGTPKSHEFDEDALLLAKAGVAMYLESKLSFSECLFLLMPFQHSENLQDQERSVQHFTALEGRAPKEIRKFFTEAREFAERHLEPIARFGRFPHRNSYLNRESTAEELAFMNDRKGFL